MPFGTVLLKAGKITIESAEGKSATINKNIIEKVALKLLGIPHLSMRLRAHYIFSFLKPKKGERMIDLGCGIGLYTLTLKKKGYDIEGVDLDKNKIKKANYISKKTGINAKFSVADIAHLPFKNNEFDKVIFSDVLEHIKEDTAALKEIARVLKPNGRLIITVPCNNKANREVMKEMGHCRPGYSIKEIKKMAGKEGLIVKKHKYYCNLLGKLFWSIIRKNYNNKVLTALLFYPFYAISLLEGLLNIKGNPLAYIIELKKTR